MNKVDGQPSKARILALHGHGSNSEITRLQMLNLGLLKQNYEIVYINGPFAANIPDPTIENLLALESGPWFSWLPGKLDKVGAENGEVLADAICKSILVVLSNLELHGPFDGIFGFSQGGVIASLIKGLANDYSLLAALKSRTNTDIVDILQKKGTLQTAIIACAGLPISLSELRQRSGLGPSPLPTTDSRTIHLIGREDNYKKWSESLALAHNPSTTQIFYLDGGHEISQLQRDDEALCHLIGNCLNDVDNMQRRAGIKPDPVKWQKSSNRSFLTMANETQVATVKIDEQELPQTIVAMLVAARKSAPALRIAREQDPHACTTYGQLLDFCMPGGDGDLRRLGIQAGEVVAYLAPPGGSAAAAVAFLSIASQTCAVPLSAHMSEADTLAALEQYGVKHVVLFDEVNSPGVRAASAQFICNTGGHVHVASCQDKNTPGLFKYHNSLTDFERQPTLANPPNAICLLLRTSGTTSTPKVVPLTQRDLVLNAALLADGIGISEADVTYSVMPLDHIGGLSASILCSLSVGASITCDGAYSPQSMVDALTHSNPRPTWYSAVPTIHNATVRYLQDHAETYMHQDGRWLDHNLRLIRSGAAPLKEPDRLVLEKTYGCKVMATYSMSEMMPIAQPPQLGKDRNQLPGSVGVPVIASLAIVDPLTWRPLPFDRVGEVAISGPTVFRGYLNNPTANQLSRFLLKSNVDGLFQSWFLTGDLGELDADGNLFLHGRLKELIKRGGEQISPFEIENALVQHPWIQTAVCFPVPCETYGEEVGCALVLKSSVSNSINEQQLINETRKFLRKTGLAAFKFPTRLKLVSDSALPKTTSQKYIRNGLATALGMVGTEASKKPIQNTTPIGLTQSLQDKPKVDWSSLAGFRFLLACYVMFMHVGSGESWGAIANLRQFPWHVHLFFVVAGFSLAVYMPNLITRKLSFIRARILAVYPLYALAVVLALINLLPNCQPSTFSPDFHWAAQPNDMARMFCEGTPIFQDSWILNLFSTLIIYLGGLSASPLWGASWFMGYYLWFMSMYFQCLIIFPVIYNALYKNRGNVKLLFIVTAAGIGLNAAILLAFWYGYAVDAIGYGFFDKYTGERFMPTDAQMSNADKDNAVMLGYYLFAPFWMVYFVAGICVAFLYDAIRPAEQNRAHLWGYVADAITIFMIGLSVLQVAQGYIPHGAALQASFDTFFMRPDAANNYMDPGIVNRIWDTVYARLFEPVTLLWVFALATGQGWTARLFRVHPISQVLAPTAFACFLFHQLVSQWYFAITRHGEWWNWWSYRKDFYWFSPQPVPVEWYEYFYIVGLVVLFAKIVQPIDGLIREGANGLRRYFGAQNLEQITPIDTLAKVQNLVYRTTGVEVQADWSLEECGLASLGIVQFTSTLRTEFTLGSIKLPLSIADIISAKDIRGVAALVDLALSETRQFEGSEIRAN